MARHQALLMACSLTIPTSLTCARSSVHVTDPLPAGGAASSGHGSMHGVRGDARGLPGRDAGSLTSHGDAHLLMRNQIAVVCGVAHHTTWVSDANRPDRGGITYVPTLNPRERSPAALKSAGPTCAPPCAPKIRYKGSQRTQGTCVKIAVSAT